MTPGKANFTIYKGSDFNKVIRWETGTVVYKTITAVPSLAPVRLTVPSHQLPDGWRFAIQSVKGMTQLNAKKTPPVQTDYYVGTYVDADTIEINNVNALDYSAYTSGGVIVYNSPADLSGITSARMTIKDKIGGTSLIELGTTNSTIVIDSAAKTISINITPAVSSLFTFTKGVYDLELYAGATSVFRILSGSIKIIDEVTTG